MSYLNRLNRAVVLTFVCAALVAPGAGPAFAEDIWVEGKYRRDGVYVPGHYRSGPDRRPIDDTKPFSVPRDDRSRGRLYEGDRGFSSGALFGRKEANGRPDRLGD